MGGMPEFLPAPLALRQRLRLLSAAFVLSGCAALWAEQAFEKLLSTMVGASTPAAAVVLAVYFAGLTAGGMLYGRLPARMRASPLRLYAALEGVAAAWALMLAGGYDLLIPAVAPLLKLAGGHVWLLHLARGAVAALWILPTTIPMGATFPAIADGLEELGLHPRLRPRATTWMYDLNLIGAMAGAFLGPFATFPYTGVDGTLALAACLQLAAVAMAKAVVGARRPLAPAVGAKQGWPLLKGGFGPLVAVAAASGFVAFALEVVWTHLLATVLGNSVYSFAAMLFSVLLGLGLGGALAARLFPKGRVLSRTTAGALMTLAGLALAMMNPLWSHVPGWLPVLGADIRSFAGGEVLRMALSVGMLLVPATLLGTVYPLLFRVEGFPQDQRGSAAGVLGASNALGCVTGALLCGFVLIPQWGSELTLRVLTVLTAVTGVVLGGTRPSGVGVRRAAVPLAAGLAVVVAWATPAWDRLALTSGYHVYLRAAVVPQGARLRSFHEDTLGGMTTVVESPPDRDGHVMRTLLTNGKFQGNDHWEMAAQRGLALTPMVTTRQLTDALVVGLGTGVSAHVVRTMGFAHIDIAEISPGIVAAARTHFNHVNANVLEDPRVTLILEDGRNVLLTGSGAYDLISMEIASIWFAGSTNLYSQEFYQLARQHIRPGGTLQQWFQLHHLGPDEVLSCVATVATVFSHVSVWVVGGQGVVVASMEPHRVQAQFLERLQQHAPVLGIAADALPSHLADLLRHRLLAPHDMARLVRDTAFINTDRNRFLEYFSPRYNLLEDDRLLANVALLAGYSSLAPWETAPDVPPGPLADAVHSVTRAAMARALGLANSPPPQDGTSGWR